MQHPVGEEASLKTPPHYKEEKRRARSLGPGNRLLSEGKQEKRKGHPKTQVPQTGTWVTHARVNPGDFNAEFAEPQGNGGTRRRRALVFVGGSGELGEWF